MSDNSEAAARRALVGTYRHLGALRLNELASGNASCRFGDGMLISPTGASAETITEDSVVFVGLDGAWSGDHKPSSEWQMHAAIYRADPATGAVVHTHSDYCVAVAGHNAALPGFHYLVGLFGGSDVPCVPYSTFGSAELAEAGAAALKDRTACLLANHGMICRGRDLESAVKTAHRLEILCRQYVLSRQLGEPSHLTEAEWEDFFAKIRRVRYG
jgi:L-fuculose-phosphate aldolase